MPGCVALVVGMTAAALTMRSPVFDGPIAVALGGSDLSWIVGFPAAALVYAGLMRVSRRRQSAWFLPERG